MRDKIDTISSVIMQLHESLDQEAQEKFNGLVLISKCNRCNNIVRAAVLDFLDAYKTSAEEFEKEARKYNLQKEKITLIEYRKREWCDCKKIAEQLGEKFGI